MRSKYLLLVLGLWISIGGLSAQIDPSGDIIVRERYGVLLTKHKQPYTHFSVWRHVLKVNANLPSFNPNSIDPCETDNAPVTCVYTDPIKIVKYLETQIMNKVVKLEYYFPTFTDFNNRVKRGPGDWWGRTWYGNLERTLVA